MSTVEQILEQVATLPVEQKERLVAAIQQQIRVAQHQPVVTNGSQAIAANESVAPLQLRKRHEPDEAELIERITSKLPVDGERLAVLQAKRDADTLSESELFEWQQLRVAADQWRSRHKSAVVKLASLRGVTMPEIQAEFGLPVTKQKMKGRLDELREMLREDNFTLVIPERSSRPTPFD